MRPSSTMAAWRTGSPSSSIWIPMRTTASRSARRWRSSRSLMALNAASATANTQNATAFMTGRTRRSSAWPGRASTGAIEPAGLGRERRAEQQRVPARDGEAGARGGQQRDREQLQVEQEPERARRAARAVDRDRQEHAVEQEHPDRRDGPDTPGAAPEPDGDEGDDDVRARRGHEGLRRQGERRGAGEGEHDRDRRDQEPERDQVADAVVQRGVEAGRAVEARGGYCHRPGHHDRGCPARPPVDGASCAHAPRPARGRPEAGHGPRPGTKVPAGVGCGADRGRPVRSSGRAPDGWTVPPRTAIAYRPTRPASAVQGQTPPPGPVEET